MIRTDTAMPINATIYEPGDAEYWNQVDLVAAAIAKSVFAGLDKLTPTHVRSCDPYAIAAIAAMKGVTR